MRGGGGDAQVRVVGGWPGGARGRLGRRYLDRGGGEEPIAVTVGSESPVQFSAGFSPKTLSRTSYTPIQSLPACHPGLQIESPSEEECEAAIIGSGEETVEVAFPEDPPIRVTAKLQVLNGGERDRKIRMYVRGSFSEPIDGSLLTKVTITRIHRGRFGWLAKARVPQITGGEGSIVDFALSIGRQYAYKGKRESALSARCTDGKLKFHYCGSFEDGTSGETEIIRACASKG